MVTRMLAWLSPRRRARVALGQAVASIVAEAWESGSFAVPAEMEALEQGIGARLRCLVREAPEDIEVTPSLLRAQIAALHDELDELNVVSQRAEVLGLLTSWFLRWAVGRRTRRTVDAIGALRTQLLGHERTTNQLEQWVETRVQMVCSEYGRAKSRAERASAA